MLYLGCQESSVLSCLPLFKRSNIKEIHASILFLKIVFPVSILTDPWPEQQAHMPTEIEEGRIAGRRVGCKEHFIISAVQITLSQYCLFKDTEEQPRMHEVLRQQHFSEVCSS